MLIQYLQQNQIDAKAARKKGVGKVEAPALQTKSLNCFSQAFNALKVILGSVDKTALNKHKRCRIPVDLGEQSWESVDDGEILIKHSHATDDEHVGHQKEGGFFDVQLAEQTILELRP